MVGLGGGNNNCYTTSLFKPAQRLGFKVCVLIFRGAAGLELLTPRLYNAYSWEDLQQGFDFVKRNYVGERKKLIAYGVSLGGVVLQNYLIEAKSVSLDAAIMYGTPMQPDLNVGTFCQRGYGVYNYLFGFFLNRLAQSNLALVRHKMDPQEFAYYSRALKENCSLSHFDQHVTARMGGFRDRAEYYRACSATGRLHRIRTPTFMLKAKDDFTFDARSVPIEEIKKNSHILLGMTTSGGHVCHMEGLLLPQQWFYKPMV